MYSQSHSLSFHHTNHTHQVISLQHSTAGIAVHPSTGPSHGRVLPGYKRYPHTLCSRLTGGEAYPHNGMSLGVLLSLHCIHIYTQSYTQTHTHTQISLTSLETTTLTSHIHPTSEQSRRRGERTRSVCAAMHASGVSIHCNNNENNNEHNNNSGGGGRGGDASVCTLLHACMCVCVCTRHISLCAHICSLHLCTCMSVCVSGWQCV